MYVTLFLLLRATHACKEWGVGLRADLVEAFACPRLQAGEGYGPITFAVAVKTAST